MDPVDFAVGGEVLEALGAALRRARRDDHLRAGLEEAACDHQADPARRAGHERGLSLNAEERSAVAHPARSLLRARMSIMSRSVVHAERSAVCVRSTRVRRPLYLSLVAGL